MIDPQQTTVTVGVALLFFERIYKLVKDQNGNKPISEDKCRLIIYQQLEPVRKSLHRIATAVDVLRGDKSKGVGA